MKKIEIPFIFIDPNRKEPSVSFTLLVLSGIACVIANVLQIAHVTDSVGSFMEIFYASVSLYFGRKWTVAGKDYNASKAEEIVNQVETEK